MKYLPLPEYMDDPNYYHGVRLSITPYDNISWEKTASKYGIKIPEIIVECLEKDKNVVLMLLKECMENTVQLPGVALIAEPKIAYNLADLK